MSSITFRDDVIAAGKTAAQAERATGVPAINPWPEHSDQGSVWREAFEAELHSKKNEEVAA